MVVDFGTATTFEAISAKGEYLGGAIFPGIDISLDALFARAAALRRVELVEPRHVIGRSTVESMQSGVIYGYTALVDGMVTRIEAELGEKANVVSTGRSVRLDHAAVGHDPPPRAVADPARAAPHLREEPVTDDAPRRPRPTSPASAPVPYRVEVTDRAADLQAAHADLEPTAAAPASPPPSRAG